MKKKVLLITMIFTISLLTQFAFATSKSANYYVAKWEYVVNQNVDHYEVSLRYYNNAKGTLQINHKSTDVNSLTLFQNIYKDGSKFNVWVGAYDASGNVIAQGNTPFYTTLQNYKISEVTVDLS